MTKHILDRPKLFRNGRLRQSITIERHGMPKTASLTLQRRNRIGPSQIRALRYFRLEKRGMTQPDAEL